MSSCFQASFIFNEVGQEGGGTFSKYEHGSTLNDP